MLVSSDDQVKSYIKKIMSQLNKWMLKSKISKFVVVVTSKDTGEHVERWQFDVQVFGKGSKSKASARTTEKENTNPGFVSPSARDTDRD
jgi:mitotic spindle assembly checkpoint protein MAD2